MMNMEVACVAALSDCMPTMHSTHKKWANMNYRAIQEMSIRIADDCIAQQAPPVLKRLPIKSQRPKSFPIERIKVRQV